MAVELRGDGPALLFVHGFPLDRTMWRPVIAAVTGWRRIAPDLRGFGLTAAPDAGHTMGHHADDLVVLLDTLGIERAVVWGLSMGGYVAFELLRRHRARIRGLILSNTRAQADTAAVRRTRDDTIALLERDGVHALSERMIPNLLAPSSLAAMPPLVEQVRAIIAGNTAPGLIAALRAMKRRVDATPLLGTIDIPTLVVAGKEDVVVSTEEARMMAEAIAGALFTVIPDSGHLTPMEQPIPTTRVVARFLESLA